MIENGSERNYSYAESRFIHRAMSENNETELNNETFNQIRKKKQTTTCYTVWECVIENVRWLTLL